MEYRKIIKLKPVYFHWKEWEDFKNGMYRTVDKSDEKHFIEASFSLLCNHEKLNESMRLVCELWPNSARHNLTKPSVNGKAWLGQAACCLSLDSPESCTRLAWSRMTIPQCKAANSIANHVIISYLSRNKPIQLSLFNEEATTWNKCA